MESAFRSTLSRFFVVLFVLALCAGAAARYADGYATAAACSYQQQADNITQYGRALAAPSAAIDAAGTHIADITHTCDAWALGVDARGTSVIVNLETGKISSHGLAHAGQPVSALPVQVPAPLQLGR